MIDRKAYNKEYYEKHKERVLEKRKKAYADASDEVKDERRKRSLEYYLKHREAIRQKCNERYSQDEEWREKRRAYSRERQRYMQKLLDKAKEEAENDNV